MITIIVSFALAVIALLIVMFSLPRNPESRILRFFEFLPSVCSYYKALKAIEKLEISNYVIHILTTRKFKGTTVLTSKDEGFKELVKLLERDYLGYGVEVEELVMHGLTGGQPWEQDFVWLNAKIEGEERVVIARVDFTPAIQVLRELADKFVRQKIDKYIVILAIIIFILTISFIFYSNLVSGQVSQ